MTANHQRIVIGMMDGFDMEYFEKTDLPVMRRMAGEGLFKEVTGVFPSVTNANNVSIACGAWPEEHGITANSYYDPETGRQEYMNSTDLIEAPTIFRRAADFGVKSALLTSKKKTLELFHGDVDLGVAAEAPTSEILSRYGSPPDIYSREINYWLWGLAADLLKTRPDLEILYVHITDYPMHMWNPEQEESREHLIAIDELMGEAYRNAPDASFFLTADHGMNHKTRCWDLARVLEENGCPVRFVLSPERDYYVVHHRNFTGCAWIWLNRPEDRDRVTDILMGLGGVEEVVDRAEAASRFHLRADRIGELIVTGEKDTMFGEMGAPYEDLSAAYRAHGSLHEMRLPLIIWNQDGPLPRSDDYQVNLDLTRRLFR